jgi:hypothetical protein
MTNPITPPPELVARWKDHWFDAKIKHINLEDYLLAQAAQWGADHELEAVEEEIITQGWFANSTHRRAQLRAARRPKPPTLKEQALALVNSNKPYLDDTAMDTIRKALEQLND